MTACDKCSSTDLVKVGMTLNGGPVNFCHCRRCEHRQWASADDGNSLRLNDVLAKVAS